MQTVEYAQNALLEGCAAHDRVVNHDEVVDIRLNTTVSDVVDMRRKVIARVALGDERAQLDVL